jgi:hypothetical protein
LQWPIEIGSSARSPLLASARSLPLGDGVAVIAVTASVVVFGDPPADDFLVVGRGSRHSSSCLWPRR